MHKNKHPNQVRFRFVLPLVAGLASTVLTVFSLVSVNLVRAATGTNEQLNYQARLLTSTGAVVPDGLYNIEFKVYEDGDGVLGGGDETLQWTETRTGGNRVTVKNGYFSIYLGSVNPFGSNIDWNQDTLWLSINIGGTGTPSFDGEMSPFTRFSSTPYALNSKQLGGLTSGQFVQLAQGQQTENSSSASIYINDTGGGNLIHLLSGLSDRFVVNNSGTIAAATALDTINGVIINAGAISGVTGFTQASGNFSQSGTGTFGTGTGAVSLNGNTTVTGTNTFSVAGGLTDLGAGLTAVGAVNINRTGTANTAVGNSTGTFTLDSNTVDISSGGAISGATGYSQSSGAFAFSGGGNFSIDSAGLDVSTGGAISNVTGFTQASGTFSSVLSTTNSAVFGSTTSGSDTLAILPQSATTTASFAGTITSVDLTGARTWTLPNVTGTICVSGDVCASSGVLGYWSRSGSTLSPSTSGDAITTSGNISTTSSGTVTSAGLLTASNGLTITTGGATVTAGNLTLTAGDLVTGATTRLTNAGALTNITGLTITSGGASISGGLNNNTGGITNAGSIAGATSITASGTIAGATLNATSTFQHNGTNGRTLNCSATEGVEDVEIRGGILITSSCRGFGLSDTNLKENVTSLPSSVLDDIRDVNVVNFDFDCSVNIFVQSGGTYRCDENELHTGVIAQDLQAIFPNLVFQGADGYYRVNYEGLSMYNLKAVQELASIIDSTGDASLNSVSIGGNTILTNTGALTNITGLTMTSGGASIAGGIDNNSGGITEAGAVSGASTVTASSTINTTGGALQTNTTDRIENDGDLVNIGNITTASGTTITTASAGTANTVLIRGGTATTGNNNGGAVTIQGGTAAGAGAVGAVVLQSGTTGNVGIGTSSAGARLQINTGADTALGMIIRQNSASQSGELLQLQTSAGGVLAEFQGDGVLNLGPVAGTMPIVNEGSLGDKINLYSNTTFGRYGFGIQALALVANLGTSAASFQVKVDPGSGQASSGTSVFGVSGTGAVTTLGTVNTTAGAIQTNSTDRIENDGDLVNIGAITAAGAIAANGGITFNNTTDTLGAHTLAGTLDANANILTNIGNAGTDFIASTGALTLAGVLTANNGVAVTGNSTIAGTLGSLTGLSSSGTITFGGLNSVGIVRTNASGVLATGALNRNDSAYFNTTLSVGNGGTGATTFTTNGILFGNAATNIQATAAGTGGQVLLANGSGVPTFTTFTGDITVSSAGLTAIQANSVALGTDTTGNYVATVTVGNGLVVSGVGAETATADITLDVATTGTSATTTSNSGLETTATGLKLLGGCSNGQILKWQGGSTAWQCSTDNQGLSDSTIKTGVVALPSVLDSIKNLQVVDYNYKCSDPTWSSYRFVCDDQTGVLAQQLALVFPDLVSLRPDSLFQVDFQRLNFYTLKAVTELANFIDSGGNGAFNTVSTGGTQRISSSGALSNISTVSASGNINTSGGGIQTAGTTRLTNAGALQNITGLTVTSGGASITGATTLAGGAINLNVGGLLTNTNINTGVSTGTVTIGGGLSPLVINSTAFDVSSTGAVSGVTTLSASDDITTTGANIFLNNTIGTYQILRTGVTYSGHDRVCGNNQYMNQMAVRGGIVTSASACSGVGLSDERLKENVTSLDDSIADLIKQVNTVNFTFKCDDPAFQVMNEQCQEGVQTGVIAQQLAQVFPELVYMDEWGNYRVKYDALNIYTLKAVGEISEDLDEVEANSVNEVAVLGLIDTQMQSYLNNGLTISGSSSFNGNVAFNEAVDFMEDVIFNKDVIFNARPVFNNDTAGFATIEENDTEVRIEFANEFADMPVVNVSNTDGQFVAYTYKDLDETGFTIIIQNPAQEDVTFSWTAFAVDDALTQLSSNDVLDN